MSVQIALLRAINLGGSSTISMADLRKFFVDLGFADVRTLLQTGNAVFTGQACEGEALERYLQREAKTRLGLQTDFLVRSRAEWDSAIAANPFPEAARTDPAHLLVVALSGVPSPAAVTDLQAAIRDREVVAATGKHLYIIYPDGIGRSRLTAALINRKLGVGGTARNWNTVLKLAALAHSL